MIDAVLAAQDRFLAKIGADERGCWLWQSCINSKGYGHFKISGRFVTAHRVSYLIFIGSIPNGLCVRHKCDVRHCVNPDHLEVGTLGDNNRDTAARGRCGAQRRTHCVNGHPFDASNTVIRRSSNGGWGRNCKACGREHAMRARARKKQLANRFKTDEDETD